jgi:Flp pilus assembly pilin Flp
VHARYAGRGRSTLHCQHLIRRLEKSMVDLTRSFWKDQSGSDTAKWAVLLALVVVVMFFAVDALRHAVQSKFAEAVRALRYR